MYSGPGSNFHRASLVSQDLDATQCGTVSMEFVLCDGYFIFFALQSEGIILFNVSL